MSGDDRTLGGHPLLHGFNRWSQHFRRGASQLIKGTGCSQEALDANQQLAYNASAYGSVWAQPTWLTDFRADIEKVDVPALIVHGTADNILAS